MILDLTVFDLLIPAAASLLYITLTAFGFVQFKKVTFFWSFQLYTLLLAIWSFSSFMMRIDTVFLGPLIWNRIMLVGMLTGPFALVHAVVDTLDIKRMYLRKVSQWAYLLVIYLMYANFSGMVVQDAWLENGVFNYRLGSGAMAAYLTSYIYLLTMIGLVYWELKHNWYDLRTRNSFNLYLLGLVIMLGGILLNINEEIGRHPFDILASTVNAVIIFYAIYKYKLVAYTRLGLQVLTMLIMMILASLIYYVFLIGAAIISEEFQPANKAALSLVMAAVTVLVVYPLRSFTLYVIDAVIIPRRHPYQQTIKDFSRKLTTVIDLDELGRELIKGITAGIKVDWVVFIIRDYFHDTQEKSFLLLTEFGMDLQARKHITLDLDASVTHQLDRVRRSYISSVITAPSEDQTFTVSRDLPKANIVIPLTFQDEIGGFILISAPWGSKIFSQYELDALAILAGQCSLSLKNAISFEQLKKQGDELAVSKNKLEAIFNGIGSPLALTDIDYTVIEVNEAAISFIGKPRERIIGSKCYKLFFSRSMACPFCRAPECLHSGIIQENEIDMDEHTYALQFHSVKMPRHSKQLFLEIIQDVSEQKKLQNEVIRSEKMAGVGALAAGVAHELNNPLAGIYGSAELLLGELQNPSSAYEYAEEILRYSSAAVDVINELSQYSRQEKREITEVDLVRVLEFSLRLAQRSQNTINVEIKRNYQAIPVIMASESEMQQVFLNIIVNAFQAMEGKGCLTLQCSESSGVISISIGDTGKGISKEHINQVFTPFFTTKEPGRGTGLGLSNCFRIVTKYDGRIIVDSTPGKGSVFTVMLLVDKQGTKQVRFVIAVKQSQLNDAFYIQRKVLVGEKGYIEESVTRDEDEKAVHILAYRGIQPVGTVSLVLAKHYYPLPIRRFFPEDQFIDKPKDSAEIIRLAVIPEMRNTLVSLGLISLVFLYARSEGVHEVIIDVFSDDKKSIDLYKKFGFKEIGTYSSPSEVTVLIQKHETPLEESNERRNHFVRPLFKRLYTMFDFGDKNAQVIREMKKIIPKIGNDAYDSFT